MKQNFGYIVLNKPKPKRMPPRPKGSKDVIVVQKGTFDMHQTVICHKKDNEVFDPSPRPFSSGRSNW